ncbi:hypothetical protein BD311DRAFT_765421, partial [Dichomitus squalens]
MFASTKSTVRVLKGGGLRWRAMMYICSATSTGITTYPCTSMLATLCEGGEL